MTERTACKAASTIESVAYQQLMSRLDDLAGMTQVFEGEIIDIKLTVAQLASQGATAKWSPPYHTIFGSILFLLIPVAAWTFSRGRKLQEDAGVYRGARAGIAFSLSTMAISAVVIGIGYARGWFSGEIPALQSDKQLSGTAYIILVVALVVIFGGLVWCFWKAMQAAGRQDPEIPEEVA